MFAAGVGIDNVDIVPTEVSVVIFLRVDRLNDSLISQVQNILWILKAFAQFSKLKKSVARTIDINIGNFCWTY